MAKAAAAVSPFAPATIPDMPVVEGVRFAACEAGIRYKGRKDLMLAVFSEGTVAAACSRSPRPARRPSCGAAKT